MTTAAKTSDGKFIVPMVVPGWLAKKIVQDIRKAELSEQIAKSS